MEPLRVRFEIRVRDVMGPLAEFVMVEEASGKDHVVFDVPINDRHGRLTVEQLAVSVTVDALKFALKESAGY